MKAGDRREERLCDKLLDETRLVRHKAWEQLARTESQGEHECAIVALLEVRECLGSLGNMVATAENANCGGLISELWLKAFKQAEENVSRDPIIVRFVCPGDKPERDKP